MSLEVHVWKITGVSPMLQNNPAGTMGGGDDGGIKAGTKKVYDDKKEAEIRTYRTAEGQFYHPSAAFRSAILVAASGRKINKKAARTIFAGSVFPVEQECLILDAKQKPMKDYTIHKCRCVVGTSGILRCRPQYSGWTMKLACEIDTELMPNLENVTEVLNIAGRIVGIGDYRPDTSKGRSGVGTYGRFSAELVS